MFTSKKVVYTPKMLEKMNLEYLNSLLTKISKYSVRRKDLSQGRNARVLLNLQLSEEKKELSEFLELLQMAATLCLDLDRRSDASFSFVILAWEALIENYVDMHEIQELIGQPGFKLFLEAGVVASVKTKNSLLLSKLVDEDNIKMLSKDKWAPIARLMLDCFSSQSREVLEILFKQLEKTTFLMLSDSSQIEAFVDSLLSTSDSATNDPQDLAKTEFIGSMIQMKFESPETAIGPLINILFSVATINCEDKEQFAVLEQLLESATKKGVNIEKSIFCKLYEKNLLFKKTDAVRVRFIELATQYLKVPLFTPQEAIEKNDVNLLMHFLKQNALINADSDLKNLVALTVQSNKISPENKINILRQIRENQVDIPGETLVSLISIAKKRKETSVLEYLLSTGNMDHIIRRIVSDPDNEMSLKIFCQLENDAFILGTGLEGLENSEVSFMVEYKILLLLLSQKEDFLSKEKVKVFQKLLETYQETEAIIQYYIETAENNSQPQTKGLSYHAYETEKRQNLSDARKNCAKKIVFLSNNETQRALFPSGWRGVDRAAGHAMLLYLEKMPDDLYRIILFNTGEGLNYHLQKTVLNKVKYCPARVFEKLDFNSAVTLVEKCVVCPKSDTIVFKTSQEKFNAKYIYESVLIDFKDFEARPFNLFPAYITTQRAGTCTAKIFSPVEQLIFGEEFDKYKLIIKKITNQYYLEQIRASSKKNQAITPDKIGMLKYSLQNFSRRLKKLERLGKVSLGETEIYFETLREYFAFVKQIIAEQEEKRLIEEQENVVSEIMWPEQVQPYNLQHKHFILGKKLEKTKEKKQEILPLKHYMFDIFSEKNCAAFLSQLEQYQENKLFFETKIVVEKFLQRIVKNEIKIDIDEVSDVFKNLNNIMIYYNHALVFCEKKEISSTSFLFNMAAFQIAYRELVERYQSKPMSLLAAFNINEGIQQFQKIFTTMSNSIFFNLYHPEHYGILQIIRANISTLDYKNNSSYLYVSKNYKNLKKVMDQMAAEVFQNEQITYREREAQRKKHEADRLKSSPFERVGKPEESPKDLTDSDKYGLISNFFTNKEGFLQKIRELTQKMDFGSSEEKVSSEFDQLYQDDFVAKELSRMTSVLEALSNDAVSNDEKRHLPFEYKHAVLSSKSATFIAKRGCVRETSPNTLQMLINSLDVDVFSDKERNVIQRLMSVRVEPGNQIFSTIEFFKNNPHLLIEQSYQVLLHCLIFEPGVLQNELIINPINLGEQILKFLKLSIGNYRDLVSLLPAGSFLYEQASFLSDFLLEYPSYKECALLLNNVGHELSVFKAIDEKGLLTADQTLSYGRLCKIYALEKLKKFRTEEVSIKEYQDFFFYYAKLRRIHSQSPLLDETTKILNDKILEAFANCHFRIKISFENEAFKNAALMYFTNERLSPNVSSVTGEFPIYKIRNEEKNLVEINFETGSVLKNDREPGLVPQKICENFVFKRHFGNQQNLSALVSSAQDKFEFEFKGNKYRIQIELKEVGGNDNNIEIYKNINDFWYLVDRGASLFLPQSIQGNYNALPSSRGVFFEPKDSRDLCGITTQILVRVLEIETPDFSQMKILAVDQEPSTAMLKLLTPWAPFLLKITPDKLLIVGCDMQGNPRLTDITAFAGNIQKEIEELELTKSCIFRYKTEFPNGMMANMIRSDVSKKPVMSIPTDLLQKIFEMKVHNFEYIHPVKAALSASDKELVKSADIIGINNRFWARRDDNDYVWELLPGSFNNEMSGLTLQKGMNIIDIVELPEVTLSKLPAIKASLFLTENGQITTFRLRDTENQNHWDESFKKLFKHLSDFIGAEHIEIYDNQEPKPSQDSPPLQVKLPSYGLHLVAKRYPNPINGTWHLFLKDKPNYRLSLDIFKGMPIKNFPHWLPFEFEDIDIGVKDKVALIPVGKFSGEKRNDVDELPKFNLKHSESHFFVKATIKKGKMIPEVGYELIYLAYLNLYQGDPIEAYRLLTSGQKKTPLLGSQSELEWLKAIIMNDNNKYVQAVFQRPDCLAVKLQAIYLLIQNHLTKNPVLLDEYVKDKVFNDLFTITFYQYLDTLHNVSKELRLPETAELTLLKFMHNNPGRVEKFQENLAERYKILLENDQHSPSARSQITPLILMSDVQIKAEVIDTKTEKKLNEKEFNNALSQNYKFPFFTAPLFLSPDTEGKDLQEGRRKNHEEKCFRDFCQNTLILHLQKDQENILLEKFDKDLKDHKKILEKLRSTILEKANSQFKEKTRHLELFGRTAKQLTMKDMLGLFLGKSLGEYEKETQLNKSEIEALHQMMYAYILQKNYYHRLQKTQNAFLIWKAEPSNSQALYDLAGFLYAKRHYIPSENPELLVLERYEKILLREEQVTMLKALGNESLDGKNKVFQLIMGGGKSKIIAPLLMKFNAAQDKLCVYRVLPALFEATFVDLKRTCKEVFDQEVVPFEFSRATPYSSLYLKNLFVQFDECLRHKGFLLATGTSLRSLGLKYYDLLEQLNKDSNNKELWEQFRWTEVLLNLLNKKSFVLIDEADADAGLNVEEELNYPYGAEEGLGTILNSAILDLHELLDSPLKALAELILNKENCILAKELMKIDLMPLHRSYLIAYLNNIPNQAAYEFIEALPTDCQHIKDILAIYRYQINNLLPVTLAKRVDENFGKTKIIKDVWHPINEMAIPYSASQTPKEGSRFSNIYTAINHTIQLQNVKGISLPVFRKIFEKFQQDAEQEFRIHKTHKMFSVAQTEAAKKFQVLTGLSINLADIEAGNQPLIEKLLQEVSKKQNVIKYALENIILPEVKTHVNMLNMNSIQEVDLYGEAIAISGTMSSWRTFHYNFTLEENSNLGIDGKTIDLLLNKNIDIHCCEGTTLDEIVSDHFRMTSDKLSNYHAIIDAGALFNDFKNQAVAEAIGKRIFNMPGNSIKYVLFFNENNVLCAKDIRNPKEPVLELRTTNVSVLKQLLGCEPKHWFTYYDQYHSRGADITQDLHAQAIVSVNKKTELRNFLQAIMRMRQFSQNQNIDIILPKNIYDNLKEKSVKSIVEFTTKNQNDTLGRQLYVAALKNIHQIFRKDLDQRVKKSSLPEKLKYYNIFSGFFTNKLNLSPFEHMGEIDKFEQIEEKDLLEYYEAVNKFWKIALTKIKLDDFEVKKIETDCKLKYNDIVKKIYPHIHSYLSEKASQKELIQRATVGSEMQIESRLENKQQSEQQLQNQLLEQLESVSSRTNAKFLSPIKRETWSEEAWKAWYLGNHFDTFHMVTPYLEENGRILSLSESLFVSQDFLYTFNGDLKKLHHSAKKPIEYVLMRYAKNKIQALIITQVEAKEIAKRIDDLKESQSSTVWIQTVNDSLYSGYFSKELSQEASNEWQIIKEQLHFLNGEIEVLEENFEKNRWFRINAYHEKLEYFKKHIMPDEPLQTENLSFIETKLLERTTKGVELKEELEATYDEEESFENFIIELKKFILTSKIPFVSFHAIDIKYFYLYYIDLIFENPSQALLSSFSEFLKQNSNPEIIKTILTKSISEESYEIPSKILSALFSGQMDVDLHLYLTNEIACQEKCRTLFGVFQVALAERDEREKIKFYENLLDLLLEDKKNLFGLDDFGAVFNKAPEAFVKKILHNTKIQEKLFDKFRWIDQRKPEVLNTALKFFGTDNFLRFLNYHILIEAKNIAPIVEKIGREKYIIHIMEEQNLRRNKLAEKFLVNIFKEKDAKKLLELLEGRGQELLKANGTLAAKEVLLSASVIDKVEISQKLLLVLPAKIRMEVFLNAVFCDDKIDIKIRLEAFDHCIQGLSKADVLGCLCVNPKNAFCMIRYSEVGAQFLSYFEDSPLLLLDVKMPCLSNIRGSYDMSLDQYLRENVCPMDRGNGLKSLQDNTRVLRDKMGAENKIYQFLEKASNLKNKNEIEKAFRERSFTPILGILQDSKPEELNNYFKDISVEKYRELLAWIKEYEEKPRQQSTSSEVASQKKKKKTSRSTVTLGDSDSDDESLKSPEKEENLPPKISLFYKLSNLSFVEEPIVTMHAFSVADQSIAKTNDDMLFSGQAVSTKVGRPEQSVLPEDPNKQNEQKVLASLNAAIEQIKKESTLSKATEVLSLIESQKASLNQEQLKVLKNLLDENTKEIRNGARNEDFFSVDCFEERLSGLLRRRLTLKKIE